MLVKTKVQADLCGVKVETLRAWAQAGKIPVVRISRRTIRFDPVDVENALKGNSKVTYEAEELLKAIHTPVNI